MTGEDSPVVDQLATTKAEAGAPLLGVAEKKALSETEAEDDGSSVVTEARVIAAEQYDQTQDFFSEPARVYPYP